MELGAFGFQIWRDRHQPAQEAMRPPKHNLRGASSTLGSRWYRTDTENFACLHFLPTYSNRIVYGQRAEGHYESYSARVVREVEIGVQKGPQFASKICQKLSKTR